MGEQPRLEASEDRFSGVSDEDLYHRSAKEPDCFEELVRRRHSRFWRLARRTVGPNLADDALQEAYRSMAHARSRFEGRNGCSFRSWAYRIVSNCALEILRREKRFLGEDGFDLAGISVDYSVEEDCADTQLVARLLDDLDRTSRRLLHARYFEGLTYEEIAEKFGVKVPFVKTRVHRARAKMARQMASMLR